MVIVCLFVCLFGCLYVFVLLDCSDVCFSFSFSLKDLMVGIIVTKQILIVEMTFEIMLLNYAT